ncbi:SET domain-containing protein SmydA-8-like [Adelges cooleyi]|uniref:SET domain-containing protein SmydA-8-like n=1 Tax=Adelges cooleyi TaxID=133065 RepID=UPI0021807099|nr:SET domain-containing protein SmydA-8-like [Adelges cooleyi]
MDADSMIRLNGRVAEYLSSTVVGAIDGRDNAGWTISAANGTTVAGRGLVAVRDYAPGDVIFADAPLLTSPRVLLADEDKRPMCAVCYRDDEPLRGCPGGCGWPVCDVVCARSATHTRECEYMRRLRPKVVHRDDAGWTVGLYNAIAAVRGLVALKKGPFGFFLNVLQKKSTDKPVLEVEELKRNVKSCLNEEDQLIMETACKIMDANAFEAIITRKYSQVSLRGLYPVAAFMNHSCVPNTMHNFNGKLEMIVKASVPIRKGQEITSSYTHLIWSTPMRQHHLLISKQFICTCRRCRDPQEFGTELSALNCTVINCQGRILPVNPLDKTAVWLCKVCAKLISHTEVAVLHKSVGSLMKKMQSFHPKIVEAFLEKYKINTNNPFVVDFRIKFIWTSVNSGLTLEQLQYKEKLCTEILNLIQTLGLGKCRLFGLINKELQLVLKESYHRFDWDKTTKRVMQDQIENLEVVFTTVLDQNTSSTGHEE